MWITWNHQDSDFPQPLTITDKVEIFYQQALGWQLHIADILANGGKVFGDGANIGPVRHSGFAVLQICLSYFEAVGQYERGCSGRSGQDFKDGVLSVFPKLKSSYGADVDKLLSLLYRGARCGLYHEFRTLKGVGLGQPPDGEAIGYDPVSHTLGISPERLPQSLKHHLEGYRARLLDGSSPDLTKNFERRFDRAG
jgi:hypothetical protein